MRAIPKFVPPGPPIDAKAAAGKLVFNIDLDSTSPYLQQIVLAEAAAAKAAGLKFKDYPNAGLVAQWQAGMSEAIAQKASAIILSGAEPDSLQPQIKAAEAHGIKVLSSLLVDDSPLMKPFPNVITVYFPSILAAQLEADWAIYATKGKLDGFILITLSLNPPMPQAVSVEMGQLLNIAPAVS